MTSDTTIATLSQTQVWWRGAHFPTGAKAALGFAAELWNADASRFEATPGLRRRLEVLGRPHSDSDIAYELTGHLLDDVIVAAGGVERAWLAIRRAHDALRAYAKANPLNRDDIDDYGLSNEAAVEAWYGFTDLIAWARIFAERLDRAALPRSGFPRQGLVPALRDGPLKVLCTKVVSALEAGPVGHARSLTNFVLHTALAAHPFSGARVRASSDVILPIPDLPHEAVTNWYHLTWTSDLDGFTLADDIWEAVRNSVGQLLEAFEQHVPDRLKRAELGSA